jgi:hypothetical protein
MTENVFLINVQIFDLGSSLTNDFLRNPPEWLKKQGALEKQVEYLRERVLIHIYERYEFQPHKHFVGYRLSTKNS